MKKFISLAALAAVLNFANAPVTAADTTTCQASWTKMDAKKQGYVMNADAAAETAAMTKAGHKMAAADRVSEKEYMAACLADVFKNMQR